jgi:hypothetical protein
MDQATELALAIWEAIAGRHRKRARELLDLAPGRMHPDTVAELEAAFAAMDDPAETVEPVRRTDLLRPTGRVRRR